MVKTPPAKVPPTIAKITRARMTGQNHIREALYPVPARANRACTAKEDVHRQSISPDRRLCADRRLPRRGAGVALGVDRLVLPAAVRLREHVRAAARLEARRPLLDRSRG